MVIKIEGVVVKRVWVRDVDSIIPYLGDRFQLVSGECVEEVLIAALISMRAFERGTNRAKTLGGELLLRLAGTHQIKEAIKLRGAGTGPRYLVVFGSGEEAEEFIGRFDLGELEPEHCSGEKLKPLMEKAALVEAL
ncbi:MAG: KEOPS complex subunit Cgi121 [Thermococcus sp.]|nr:KEOPS complex subunit Cgi121 [Thermococcus sp.]